MWFCEYIIISYVGPITPIPTQAKLLKIWINGACSPDGHHWDYYPGTLSCSQVSAPIECHPVTASQNILRAATLSKVGNHSMAPGTEVQQDMIKSIL